jgi:hypothetical protein
MVSPSLPEDFYFSTTPTNEAMAWISPWAAETKVFLLLFLQKKKNLAHLTYPVGRHSERRARER